MKEAWKAFEPGNLPAGYGEEIPPYVEEHPEYPPAQCWEKPYSCPDSADVFAVDGYPNSDRTDGE